jgi:Pentapeptide repeats (8 copies)
MRDSAEHHNDVIEVLTAFIRDRAPQRGRRVWHPVTGSVPDPGLPPEPTTDVQAALTALGHRPRRPERQTIDLSDLHLAGTNLGGTDLTGVDLGGTDLTGVNLASADLTGAYLGYANLTRAYLGYANLTRAQLDGISLTGAERGPADLTDAELRDADLRHAYFGDADLRHAYLVRANLTGALLGSAAPEGWTRDANGLLKRASTSRDSQGHQN